MSRFSTALLTLAITGVCSAQALIDGTLSDEIYQTPNAVQNTSTSFGNNTLEDAAYANGSELDIGFAVIDQGILHIGLVGSLESNWNKLDVFIDCREGGQQRILGINPDVDYNAVGVMGDDGSGNGLRFDPGFEADYYLTVGCNNHEDMGIIYWASGAQLKTNGDGTGMSLGFGTTIVNAKGEVEVTPSLSDDGIQLAINNSAVGGVGGGTGLDCGDSLEQTGIEIAIPLWVLDWDFEGIPFDDVRITAMINSSGHDLVSNQLVGGIMGGGNLGYVRDVDLGLIPGDQFMKVGVAATPCPEILLGACCFANGECWETMQQQLCFDARGHWMDDGTTCDDCNLGGDDCPTDANGDDVIDVNDLLKVISEFGNVCP